MTGSALQGDGRCMRGRRQKPRGGLGERGDAIGLDRNLADDGKRFPSGGRCILGRRQKPRGGLGERGDGIFPDGNLADDGKRFQRWTLYWRCFSQRSFIKRGRGSGRGGSIIEPGTHLADLQSKLRLRTRVATMG